MILTQDELRAVRREADAFMDRLSELGCESVRVFVAMQTEGSVTVSETCGRGNFNAQYGQVKRWTVQQENQFDSGDEH
jgi:hypothetical protein